MISGGVTEPEKLDRDPYAESPPSKEARLLSELNELIAHHVEHCPEYARILRAAHDGYVQYDSLAKMPSLPVRVFKELELVSVSRESVVKTLTSSGTTSQRPSRIFLDKETAKHQANALVRIVRSFLGNKRLPMLILDHRAVLSDRQSFSARGAGILGFSQFGADHTYALKDHSMDPDWQAIDAFLVKHKGERILLFGFTSILWQHLLIQAEDQGKSLDLSSAVLIHGGGWKKLAHLNISPEKFKQRLRASFGIPSIHNYYGMVEQTGSIFMECEEGVFHPADYSEVIVRHPRTLSICQSGDPGLIETLSTIPRSYPGHILLTEDIGLIHATDGCQCGRRGTQFSVIGRLPSAELRGCADTYGVRE